jgi:hypothetical protein
VVNIASPLLPTALQVCTQSSKAEADRLQRRPRLLPGGNGTVQRNSSALTFSRCTPFRLFDVLKVVRAGLPGAEARGKHCQVGSGRLLARWTVLE